MNEPEDTLHLYEQYFKIKDSDDWSLRDLLQYALELILSGEEEYVPTNISKDFSLTREYLLAEIDNAVREQKKNKRLPDMPIVASELSCLGAFLKQDELDQLEKLLNGDFRGRRGIKKDRDETKHVDMRRWLAYKDHAVTLTRQEALDELVMKENIDERNVERSIKRGSKYFLEDLRSISHQGIFNGLDIIKSLRHRMIKSEIQRLLDRSVQSTNKDVKHE